MGGQQRVVSGWVGNIHTDMDQVPIKTPVKNNDAECFHEVSRSAKLSCYSLS